MANEIYNPAIEALEEQRRRLDALIAALKAAASGAPIPDIGGPDVGAGQPADVGPKVVRSDTFFGMKIPEAVRKYLAIQKRPQKAKEIADGLAAGGLLSEAKSFYANVSTALRRLEEAGEVVRIGDTKTWALAEWYPNRPRAAPKPDRAEGSGAAADPAPEGALKVV